MIGVESNMNPTPLLKIKATVHMFIVQNTGANHTKQCQNTEPILFAKLSHFYGKKNQSYY